MAIICTVVTPCYNAEKYIYTTIGSVLNQTAFLSGRAELDYIIVDGNSTDSTINVIQETVNSHRLGKYVKIISEHDNGMYDALVKGMKIAKGNIFSYINADDFYNQTAFDIVIEIMKNNDVKWLTGWQIGYNEAGQIISLINPFYYRKNFIKQGLYGPVLPVIQQESTFWRAELNQNINFEILSKFKLAGDYYLWTEFAKHFQLYIVETYLGGFRHRKENLGKSGDYRSEQLDTVIGKLSFYDKITLFFDRIFWKYNGKDGFVGKLKMRISQVVHFVFDQDQNRWVTLSGYPGKRTIERFLYKRKKR
ncbi:glycosyltransferase, family 2 [Treponema primitia ZAS-2]|uniref:Glycosyltransferase, family 2 n=1 Tax=Treponema primitia (strain ATCC BAA-887 / DSM 12427 / ZAS-2) TaxID=545694 RepID=F5YHJ0_TREPZ|nr:glycosyltransferase [Treponema primitia]AEF83914.1 glycosyltransferase, family 2 [Treponema primitia ZAS-2]